MVEQNRDDAVRSHWLAAALELMLTDRAPDAAPVNLELQTGDQPITIELRDAAIRTHLGPAENPDVTLVGPPNPIMGLLLDCSPRGRQRQGDHPRRRPHHPRPDRLTANPHRRLELVPSYAQERRHTVPTPT
jgi:hypothetical protein